MLVLYPQVTSRKTILHENIFGASENLSPHFSMTWHAITFSLNLINKYFQNWVSVLKKKKKKVSSLDPDLRHCLYGDDLLRRITWQKLGTLRKIAAISVLAS